MEHYQEKNYLMGVLYLFFFHYNIFWILISFWKSCISQTSSMSLKYIEDYSLIPKYKLSEIYNKQGKIINHE